MRKFILALTALFTLAGCESTESLMALRQAKPAEDKYQAALAKEYETYASEKLASYQWWASDYFANKGLAANDGQDVRPEEAANWKQIPLVSLPEMNEAREKLLDALPAAKTYQPAEGAKAVVDYDRWIVLAANNANIPAIAEGRARFFKSLNALGVKAEPVTAIPSAPLAVVTPEPTPAPAPEPIPVIVPEATDNIAAPSVPLTTSTLLYFPFDSASLSGSAAIALQQMVDSVTKAGDVTIVMNGHADRAGPENYNMRLSEARAKFVQRALIRAGVPETKTKYFAFGETDPDVATEDGVAEPLNRRVEIFVE